MRVLHVDPERGWGGGERQVQLLLRELAQRGHEQTLAADPDGRLAQVLPGGRRLRPPPDRATMPTSSRVFASARSLAGTTWCISTRHARMRWHRSARDRSGEW